MTAVGGIGRISPGKESLPILQPQDGMGPGSRSQPARPFSEVLRDAIEQVNALQLQAQDAAEALARGDVQDVHQVSLAIERAQLALELTVAVRNKVLEAYQEVSRMQV
ncbi:flagellar hook-basal body complex protein FliE [Carboxydochorda subterranea]|uniref:Flagellar hook-basal body complex protein FliE n=1 Tax=Carboxydichorda subterranea TaxID=3109565 RepID=A0ABZ1C005_9FIRM|nr:flagellar hook-basal body complex protein FliE [Limnochorda sp. L945t]WRP18445.1 flagellar hook-basal body complex protein FliE [Limnochorda sp. L945t]